MTVERLLKNENTQSIPAGGSGAVELTVPEGEKWALKTINVTPGANTTVDKILVDGEDTKNTAGFDVEAEFGVLLLASEKVRVEATNAAAGAESLKLEVTGGKLPSPY